MMKQCKTLAVLILIPAMLFTVGCASRQKSDLNVTSLYNDLDSFLNDNNIDINDCYLCDPPSDTDIAFNIETKQIKFLMSGVAVEINSHENKYDFFNFGYDKRDSLLSLFKPPSKFTYQGMKLAEFIEFINNSDFAPLIDPTDSKTAKYYELRTDGKYYIQLDDYDFSLPNEYTYYLYKDGSFEKLKEPKENVPVCTPIFLLAFSQETGELKGNTKVIILYPLQIE